MIRLFACLLFCCSFFFTTAGPAFAGENWPEFRGPTGEGHSDSTGLPLQWSETLNVAWKTDIHGKGWSTPLVWGDQIWLTTATADGTKMSVLCIDRKTGKVLLDRVQIENKKADVEPLSNPVNCYASPTGVIEDGRVFLHWGSYGTVCIDTKTFKTLWERRDLECQHFRGPGSSLVSWKDMIILTMDGVDVQYSIALSKKDGKAAWKTDRRTDFKDLTPDGKPKAGGDYRKAYCTPTLAEINGKVRMLSCGSKAAYAYNPDDGSVLWKITYVGYSNAARPVFAPLVGKHGMWVVNTGYPRPELWGVKANGKGDVTKTHIAWKGKRNIPRRSSPVLVGSMLFMIDDGGIASCIDVATGDLHWRQRFTTGKEQISSSPVFVDGRVYFFDQSGNATVVAPGKELKILAKNKLGDGFMASPAIAGKAFYLRSKSALYRVEKD